MIQTTLGFASRWGRRPELSLRTGAPRQQRNVSSGSPACPVQKCSTRFNATEPEHHVPTIARCDDFSPCRQFADKRGSWILTIGVAPGQTTAAPPGGEGPHSEQPPRLLRGRASGKVGASAPPIVLRGCPSPTDPRRGPRPRRKRTRPRTADGRAVAPVGACTSGRVHGGRSHGNRNGR